MKNESALLSLKVEFSELFLQLSSIQQQIKAKLEKYSDGKNLKGDELVGWLGEIYGKTLLGGTLVHDREEHDFVTSENWRVSVKTRRGSNSGWKQTSAIPQFEGDDSPTHLMFVHLNEDYSLDRIWLFDWDHLVKNGRFKEHIVRGIHRSYYFFLDDHKDEDFVIFPERVSIPLMNQRQAQRDRRITGMTIRARAMDWLRRYYPSEVGNDLRASKYHEPQNVWFFTFPVSFFDASHAGNHINILCENPDNENEFYYLRVPYQFFRQNRQRFDIRSTGDNFDLHISGSRHTWMVDKRGNNVDFSQFIQK